ERGAHRRARPELRLDQKGGREDGARAEHKGPGRREDGNVGEERERADRNRRRANEPDARDARTDKGGKRDRERDAHEDAAELGASGALGADAETARRECLHGIEPHRVGEEERGRNGRETEYAAPRRRRPLAWDTQRVDAEGDEEEAPGDDDRERDG